jgi:hypothetical protein
MTPEELAPPREIAGARCRRTETVSDYQKTNSGDILSSIVSAFQKK